MGEGEPPDTHLLRMGPMKWTQTWHQRKAGNAMTRVAVVLGLLAVALVLGCAAGPPTAQEMGRVYAAAAPTMMQQGFSNMAQQSLQQGGQMPNDRQMFDTMAEPLYQAAQSCGMSRSQCKAGMEKMLRDPSYAQAVKNAAGAAMLQQSTPR